MPPRTRLQLVLLEDRAVPAVVYTVTGTGDDDTRDDVLTLREALLAQRGDIALSAGEQAHVAATAPGLTVDTIRFDAGLAGQTVTLAASDGSAANRYGPTGFVVTTAVAIDGTGAAVTLSGGGTERLFAITVTGDLTLSNLTLRDGLAKGGDGSGGAAGLGGAVFVDQGALTIRAATLTGNRAAGGAGEALVGGPFGFPVAGAVGGGGLGGSSTGSAGGGPNGGTGFGPAVLIPSGPAAGFGGGGHAGGRVTVGALSGGFPLPGSPPPPQTASYVRAGDAGGFGGGGGAGYGTPYAGTVTPGGAGGFGGGGGAGGTYRDPSPYAPPTGNTAGGFGGGSGGGGGAGLGGAIFSNGGTVSVLDAVLTGNAATGGSGSTGTNGGRGYGGAVFSRNGVLTIAGGTLSGNAASTSGAGVYVLGDAVFGGAGDTANTGTAVVTLAGGALDTAAAAALAVATNGTATAEVRLAAARPISTGGVTFGAGTRLLVDVAGGTGAPLLTASGAVDLGGAGLTVTTANGIPAGTVSLVKPTGTASVGGTFAGVGEGTTVAALSGQPFVASYTGPGNAVALTAATGSAARAAVVSVAATAPVAVETGAAQPAKAGRFTLTRTGDTTAPLTVNYTLGGTATNGTHYQRLSGTVTFAAGAATATVDVNVIDDAVDSPTRTVILKLAAGAGYVFAPAASAVVSVADNDVTVTLVATDATAGERLATQTPDPGRFTLTRTGDTTAPLTVNYTVSGTATNGVDYQRLSGTVTFAAGSATATVDVNVIDDAAFNGTRTVILSLATGAGYAFSSTAATVSIADNENLVSVTATDATAGERRSDQAPNPGRFTLTRTGDTSVARTVNYTLSGTAANGVDYQPLPGTVTFAAGASTADVDVTVVDDGLVQGTRTVVLSLDSGTGYAVAPPSTATVTVADNDNTVSVAATDASASERTSGQTPDPARFTFTRAGDTSAPLVVSYTLSGTAVNGVDYQALPAQVTIAADATTVTVDVDVIDNALADGTRTVILSLVAGSNYAPADPTITVASIADNEPSGPTAVLVSVTATDARASERGAGQAADPGRFTLTRSGSPAAALTVGYTLSGTAANGTDYQALPTQVTFAAGSATATVDVNVIDNAFADGTRTVVLSLTGGPGYTVATPAGAAVAIADNENAVSVVATDASAGERAAGQPADPGRFTLTRAGNTSAALTVSYTLGGTAAPGIDYQALPGTVTFAAGSAAATIDVNAIDNGRFDGTRTVVLSLDGGPGYGLALPANAVVSIADDDTTVSVAATDPTAGERAAGQAPDSGRFTFTRVGDIAAPLTVRYTLGGAAVNGTDYAALPGAVTFAAGSSTAVVDVSVLDNATADGTRTVTLTLVAAPAYQLGAQTQDAVTIADNDHTVTVVATDPGASEQGAGRSPDPGQFTLTRTGDTTAPLTVNYTLSGTATNGVDYQPLPGTVTFAAGASTADVDVVVIDNAVIDGGRTVTLTLGSGPDYVTAVPAAATVTITDDDAAGVIAFATAVGSVAEGQTLTLTLTRTGGTSGAVSVPIIVSGTATRGADFTLSPVTVTFADGASTATVTLAALGDAVVEGDEAAILDLGPPTGGAARGATARATVDIADRTLPIVSVTASVAGTSEYGPDERAAPGQFVFTRSGDPTAPLTVTFVLGGTAVNGRDYQELPGAVTFAAGAATAAVSISAVNNSTVDGPRTAVLTVAPGDGYVTEPGAAAAATVTIADNDAVLRRVAVGSSALGAVKVFDDGSAAPTFSLLPFPGYAGGVSVAVGDVTGDGVPDLVVGATDLSSHVKVFDGRTGAEIASFLTFVNFNNGVGVAAGDLDGDGRAEIIVGALTAAPHVKVFALAGGAAVERASFLAFPGSSAGITVAAGDTDGDGQAEVVVGSRGAPHVKTFDLLGNELRSFLAPGLSGGIAVGAGDLDGDRVAEILVGGVSPAGGSVTVFGADQQVRAVAPLGPVSAPPAASAADTDGDGIEELIVAAGPVVTTLDGRSLTTRDRFSPFPGFLGELFVG